MTPRRLIGCVVVCISASGFFSPAFGQLAPRTTDEWIKTLDGPQRLSSLKIPEIISTLHMKPGDIVADIGAGSGVLEVPFAQAVAPGGKVYAEDVYEGFMPTIQQKAREANLTNVTTVLGKFEDPTLPSKDVDIAMFHDVLHHIQDRAGFVKRLATYMKPSGRIVVIDYSGDKSSHPEPENQVTKAQVTGWMAQAGFTKVEDNTTLFPDNKMYMVFSRAAR